MGQDCRDAARRREQEEEEEERSKGERGRDWEDEGGKFVGDGDTGNLGVLGGKNPFALQFVRDGNVAKVMTRLIHEAVEKLLEVVAQSFDSPPSLLFPVLLPVGMATDIVVRDNSLCFSPAVRLRFFRIVLKDVSGEYFESLKYLEYLEYFGIFGYIWQRMKIFGIFLKYYKILWNF